MTDPTNGSPDDGDRRSFERVPLETEVSLESDSQFFAGLSGDVSEGGIFVATWRTLPIGAHVTVQFLLPTGETVSATGVVRWTRASAGEVPPGLGIAFESVPEASLQQITSFCRFRPPLYHEDV
jgi:uncharacterized protein (TIGR02266 family)